MGGTGKDLEVWLGDDNTGLKCSLCPGCCAKHPIGTMALVHHHSPPFTDQETKVQPAEGAPPG